MNSRSWELKELYYTNAQKRFRDKLFEVIEPLVEMFTPVSPPKVLPPLETAFIETLNFEDEVEAQEEVTPPPLVTKIATVSRTNLVVEAKHIPLVLKTLE